MTINEELRLGRAKNAVLTFLEKSLYVPKIYINAIWDGHHVDVLAIDRDGAGDVNAVLLFARSHSTEPEAIVHNLTEAIYPLLKRFEDIPAQYKYIAAVDMSPHGSVALPGLPHAITDASYAPDGLGRVGYLSVDFVHGAEPRVVSVFKPERFRAKIAKLADSYVQEHTADWEIRA